MKKILILTMVLGACSRGTDGQSTQPRLDAAKNDVVERPIKKAVLANDGEPAEPKLWRRPKGVIERPIKEAAAAPGPENYDLKKTGIEWHKGLDAVLGKGKPILLLQILGNYDEVYC